KGKRNYRVNSRPMNIPNDNVEIQQGNMRGKRILGDDTKGYSNLIGAFSEYKKLENAPKKEKSRSEADWNTGKVFKSTLRQGERSDKNGTNFAASREDNLKNRETEEQPAPKKVSILL